MTPASVFVGFLAFMHYYGLLRRRLAEILHMIKSIAVVQ